MKQNRIRDMVALTLQSGNAQVPHSLFKYYKTLRLNEPQVMLILHILSFIQQEGKFFPTVYELQERMAAPDTEVIQHLQYLVSENYIKIIVETDENGIRSERYDLQPLFDRLADCLINELEQLHEHEEETQHVGLLTTFEREFGRPLSPMECEMLTKWIDEDGQPEELVIAALKEAVFTGKLNFKYIDRILFEWQNNRIRTVEQAKQYAHNFRRKGSIYQTPKSQQQSDDFPFYDWVKEARS